MSTEAMWREQEIPAGQADWFYQKEKKSIYLEQG